MLNVLSFKKILGLSSVIVLASIIQNGGALAMDKEELEETRSVPTSIIKEVLKRDTSTFTEAEIKEEGIHLLRGPLHLQRHKLKYMDTNDIVPTTSQDHATLVYYLCLETDPYTGYYNKYKKGWKSIEERINKVLGEIQYNVGLDYSGDSVRAKNWFRKALRNGYLPAKQKLDNYI